jgi:hypothetical protein
MTGHASSRGGHGFRVGGVAVIERNRFRADYTRLPAFPGSAPVRLKLAPAAPGD